jgi:hypothetical protein
LIPDIGENYRLANRAKSAFWGLQAAKITSLKEFRLEAVMA